MDAGALFGQCQDLTNKLHALIMMNADMNKRLDRYMETRVSSACNSCSREAKSYPHLYSNNNYQNYQVRNSTSSPSIRPCNYDELLSLVINKVSDLRGDIDCLKGQLHNFANVPSRPATCWKVERPPPRPPTPYPSPALCVPIPCPPPRPPCSQPPPCLPQTSLRSQQATCSSSCPQGPCTPSTSKYYTQPPCPATGGSCLASSTTRNLIYPLPTRPCNLPPCAPRQINLPPCLPRTPCRPYTCIPPTAPRIKFKPCKPCLKVSTCERINLRSADELKDGGPSRAKGSQDVGGEETVEEKKVDNLEGGLDTGGEEAFDDFAQDGGDKGEKRKKKKKRSKKKRGKDGGLSGDEGGGKGGEGGKGGKGGDKKEGGGRGGPANILKDICEPPSRPSSTSCIPCPPCLPCEPCNPCMPCDSTFGLCGTKSAPVCFSCCDEPCCPVEPACNPCSDVYCCWSRHSY